ncbi:alpha/beta fold hydrolase [Bacillus changyiensis]|uniref:alpha/beta fold hydrolase n=1 Tax=Bacillus changyiensis TaxID=3004103 RepID=UPI0022DED6DF|nr:alpha/beta fold hydrolase [Bacillus changyiensis]MDA1476875.1 alpha/beta fold hydrolase [Bacillus changyiensis]
MLYYYREKEITEILKTHERKANQLLKQVQSNRILEVFKKQWVSVGCGEITTSVNSNVMTFDSTAINNEIDDWINELDKCVEVEENIKNNLKATEDPYNLHQTKYNNITNDVITLKGIYRSLKADIKIVKEDFKNAVRIHHAPMREALTDLSILYNSVNHVEGDFSDFKNVSVYIHGIEDTRKGFKNSALKAANKGEIVVIIKRDSKKSKENKEYYIVEINEKGEKELKKVSFKELKDTKVYREKKERLHIIYEPKVMNEHRQSTSDDLAEELNKMGLMNGKAKIDMFGHSYGGRRSLQFAMDYPEKVRSITTVGTPYDKNDLAKVANNARSVADTFAKRNTTDTSNYLDFNKDNRKNIDGKDYSNAYTDLDCEAMTEDINHLKSANPEVYQKLKDINITAVAGNVEEEYVNAHPSDTRTSPKYKKNSDEVVSVKSQHGDILGELIDKKLEIDVKGNGITRPAHIYETEDDEFVDLIKKVNKKEAE